MSEPVSFYVNDDPEIIIGSKKMVVKVRRLPYKTASKVLGLIEKFIRGDMGVSLNILSVLRKKGEEKEKQEAIQKAISEIIVTRNTNQLIDLMKALSDKCLTDEHIETMQYTEICDIIKYLVEINFSALKNCLASLGQMSTLGSQK